MSELALLLPKLEEQLNRALENLDFAEATKSTVLVDKYSAEVEELKEMIMHIERPQIDRQRRAMSTQKWREFHVVK